MNLGFSRLNILIFLIFVGPFLQGCGSKNNAPFHVYRSALEESGQQKIESTDVLTNSRDVRIAGIGFNREK